MDMTKPCQEGFEKHRLQAVDGYDHLATALDGDVLGRQCNCLDGPFVRLLRVRQHERKRGWHSGNPEVDRLVLWRGGEVGQG